MALSQADIPADKALCCRLLWAAAMPRGNSCSSGFSWIPPSLRAPQPHLHPPDQAWPMGRFILYGKKVGQASHRCLFGCLLRPCQDLNALVQQKWQGMPERQTGAARHCPALRWQPVARPGAGQHTSPGRAFWLQGHLPLPAPGPDCSKLSPLTPDSDSLPLHPKDSQGHICWVTGSKAALFVSDKPGGADKRESVSVITTNAAH